MQWAGPGPAEERRPLEALAGEGRDLVPAGGDVVAVEDVVGLPEEYHHPCPALPAQDSRGAPAHG